MHGYGIMGRGLYSVVCLAITSSHAVCRQAYEKVRAKLGFLTQMQDKDQNVLEDSCAELVDFYHSNMDLQEP